MALTNFPFGVTSFGIPVLSGDTTVTTGQAWFVSSVTGSSSYDGKTPATPFATMAAAVSAATASQGDTVYVMPGHTETCIGAGTIALSKAGIRWVGLGWGTKRPTINYTTATTATFDITAANNRIENFIFAGLGFDAVANMINVKTAANDTQFINCEFRHADGTNQASNVILTDASADRMLVLNCIFKDVTAGAVPTAGTNSAISLVGGDGISIIGCEFYGAYHATTGIILQSTTLCTELRIEDCHFNNLTASNSKAIVLGSTCTGVIRRCHFQMLSGTTAITGAAISWVGQNYAAAAVATIGTLI